MSRFFARLHTESRRRWDCGSIRRIEWTFEGKKKRRKSEYGRRGEVPRQQRPAYLRYAQRGCESIKRGGTAGMMKLSSCPGITKLMRDRAFCVLSKSSRTGGRPAVGCDAPHWKRSFRMRAEQTSGSRRSLRARTERTYSERASLANMSSQIPYITERRHKDV